MSKTLKLVAWVLGMSACIWAQIGPSKAQQVESHLAQAREFLQSNRPELAAREFAAILGLDPDNADAHANLGVLLFFRGDYAKAAPDLRRALELRPDLWKIEALLGLCEKRLGETASARKHLEEAFPKLQEEKLRVETGLELTDLYYAGNELEKAAGMAGVLRQLRPSDPDILYTSYRIYSDLADESLLIVAMTSPGSARMRQMIGNQMARRGNIDGAIQQFRQVLRIDPKLPGVHFQLAEMLNASSSTDNRAEAGKEYERALAENPSDTKSLCRLADMALGKADLENALARYRRAVELQPHDAAANLGLAKALQQAGKGSEAERYLLEAEASEPFDPVIHMRLATLYRESARPGEAARELAEFKRIKTLKDQLKDVFQETPVPSSQDQPREQVPGK